jgi:hypothetical protein
MIDEARRKKESWEMTMKLYREGRISMNMAMYGLKSSGHSREEAEQWLCEVKEINHA